MIRECMTKALVSFSNLCLKDSRDGVDLISSGSLLHSRIVDGRFFLNES